MWPPLICLRVCNLIRRSICFHWFVLHLPLALSCPALPCPAVPCPALRCSALPLPCPALPCPGLAALSMARHGCVVKGKCLLDMIVDVVRSSFGAGLSACGLVSRRRSNGSKEKSPREAQYGRGTGRGARRVHLARRVGEAAQERLRVHCLWTR